MMNESNINKVAVVGVNRDYKEDDIMMNKIKEFYNRITEYERGEAVYMAIKKHLIKVTFTDFAQAMTTIGGERLAEIETEIEKEWASQERRRVNASRPSEEKYREMVEEALEDGYTWDEIAEELGLPYAFDSSKNYFQ